MRETPVQVCFQTRVSVGEGAVFPLLVSHFADLCTAVRKATGLRHIGRCKRPVLKGERGEYVRGDHVLACTTNAAHHTVMSTAAGVEAFRDFAEMAELELLVIDEQTSLPDFEQQVRWHQAYNRLAQGF